MFALERIRIIKNYLYENKQVEVHALSSMLNVSEVTIRRDLEKLEKEGVLTRTHGGAVINEEDSYLVPDTAVDFSGEYRDISRVAVHMIQDGDVILLTPGEIASYIAKDLSKKEGITVLTNYIPAATVIAGQPNNRVVLLGGDVTEDGKALYGSISLANLRRFHVTKLFGEIDGVNEQLQFSVSSHEKAEFLEAGFESCDEQIIVCPPGVFNSNAFCRLGTGLNNFSVVTGTGIPDTYKQRFFSRNIRLYTSVDLFEGKV